VAAAGERSALVPPAKAGWEGWMVGPFKGLASWMPQGDLFASIAFSVLMALMFACYLVVLGCAARLRTRWALAALLGVHLLFLLGPPLQLTDVFNYLNYTRLWAVRGINPYIDPPAVVPVDSTYAFATWHHLRSPYGPLFTLVSWPAAVLGVPVGYWVLKVATAAASLGCLGMVWRLAERRGRAPLPAVLFVGLNPLVIVYGLGGVHNDFFMVLAILAGVSALLTGREARAGGALVAAAAMKIATAFVLPFALAGAAREQRRALAAGALAAASALAAISIAAFGFNPPGLGTQSALATPLSPPNLLGLALGQGGATAPVRLGVQAGLVVVLLWLLRRVVRGGDWITLAGWGAFALVVSLTWEMPWYVVWLLPFAALGRSAALRRTALLLSAFLLVTLAPVTGYLLTDVCGCNPADTSTGQRNYDQIQKFLR
jgi:hypothetical protein